VEIKKKNKMRSATKEYEGWTCKVKVIEQEALKLKSKHNKRSGMLGDSLSFGHVQISTSMWSRSVKNYKPCYKRQILITEWPVGVIDAF